MGPPSQDDGDELWSSAEPTCCVCFLPTDDLTACGHVVCDGCVGALKSWTCPVCRRSLPPPARTDFAALAREARAMDLRGLCRAHRRASCAQSAEARRARAAVAEAMAIHLQVLGLQTLRAALPRLPLQDVCVLEAAAERLQALARQARGLDALCALAHGVEPLREAVPELEGMVDGAVMEASQRVVRGLSLRELQAGAEALGWLWESPGVDAELLAVSLREALLEGLPGEGFDREVAARFARAISALSKQRLLGGATDGYVACLFAARMACLLSSASPEDLDCVEGEVLPQLPASPEWAETRTNIARSLERQTKALAQLRLGGSSGPRSPSLGRIVREMRRIDAGLEASAAAIADCKATGAACKPPASPASQPRPPALVELPAPKGRASSASGKVREPARPPDGLAAPGLPAAGPAALRSAANAAGFKEVPRSLRLPWEEQRRQEPARRGDAAGRAPRGGRPGPRTLLDALAAK